MPLRLASPRCFMTTTALCLLLGFAGTAVGAPLPRTLVLSSGWRFQPDPLDVGSTQGWQRPDFDRRGWRTVAVPSAWDEYDTTMDGYEGVCWYAFRLPAEEVVSDSWQRLRFGRVNHRATVWIDGEKVAEDSLGYLPFEVQATPRLEAGRPAWIVVRVENGTRYDWLPGTTTVEWVQYGGLLEPVELLTTAPAYIAGAKIDARPRGSGATVAVVVTVENSRDAAFHGRIRVEVAGRHTETAVEVGPRRAGHAQLEFVIPQARRWSPEDPALYHLEVLLLDGTRAIDDTSERFGVRSIETRGRQILLNGQPIRIRGVNRYNEFPGCGPVADEAAIRADLRAVRAAGANLVRVHFPQTPATLRIADELGLFYMEEVPLNWWRASWHPPAPPEYQNDRIIDSAEQALERMVRRDANHPSIIIWSMANECRSYDSLGVRAMERLLRRARALDPTRLLTYAANRSYDQQRAFALADLVAVNLYFGMWEGETAEHQADLEARVRRPTSEALVEIAGLFPEKPVLLSEFGTIGVPGTGGDMRFSEDYQAAYLAAVWQAVRDRPEICGGIVWSWADYRHRRGFTNDYPAFFGPFGLVTLDRKPKKALAALREMWKRDAGQ
jgi:beta-galactosidase/beta-glucuronidase